MSVIIYKDSIAQPLYFKAVSATDGSAITTGVSIVSLQKNGATVTPAGSLSHINDGTWRYVPAAAEVDTLGTLALTCTEASMIPTLALANVVPVTWGELFHQNPVGKVDTGTAPASTGKFETTLPTANLQMYAKQSITFWNLAGSGQTYTTAVESVALVNSKAELTIHSANPLPIIPLNGDDFQIGPGYLPV